MNEETLDLLNLCNKSIIKFRGIYAEWSKEHQLSYNEMLVFYMLRENGYCSQKQICDNYLLPKQTIHHVISSLKDKGYLVETEDSMPKDKKYILTESGEAYVKPYMLSLNRIEKEAVEAIGADKLNIMCEILEEYSKLLQEKMEECHE